MSGVTLSGTSVERTIAQLRKLAAGSMAGFPKDTCEDAIYTLRTLKAERDRFYAEAHSPKIDHFAGSHDANGSPIP